MESSQWSQAYIKSKILFWDSSVISESIISHNYILFKHKRLEPGQRVCSDIIYYRWEMIMVPLKKIWLIVFPQSGRICVFPMPFNASLLLEVFCLSFSGWLWVFFVFVIVCFVLFCFLNLFFPLSSSPSSSPIYSSSVSLQKRAGLPGISTKHSVSSFNKTTQLLSY